MLLKTWLILYIVKEVLLQLSDRLTPVRCCFLTDELNIEEGAQARSIHMPWGVASHDTRRHVGHQILQQHIFTAHSDGRLLNWVHSCMNSLVFIPYPVQRFWSERSPILAQRLVWSWLCWWWEEQKLGRTDWETSDHKSPHWCPPDLWHCRTKVALGRCPLYAHRETRKTTDRISFQNYKHHYVKPACMTAIPFSNRDH